jgi:hypothetical protein
LDIIKKLKQLVSGSNFNGATGFNGGYSAHNNFGGSSVVTGNGLPSWSDCDKLIRDGNIA